MRTRIGTSTLFVTVNIVSRFGRKTSLLKISVPGATAKCECGEDVPVVDLPGRKIEITYGNKKVSLTMLSGTLVFRVDSKDTGITYKKVFELTL